MTTADYIKRVRSLRDDLTVEAFGTFGGNDREASMAIAKLDEAELWLIRRGLRDNSHLLVDKAEYIAKLDATAGATVATDRSNHADV